ncbi:hypothetical protein DL762_001711 [Monosporascus cannonballus]|uniref:Uncharacterized protein n=1 Tax=Monosporascus cannonballus TaxID=155416 RepID=A0ABY0HFG3_9PEZI|nr:hypothetical protein DL762_001711 [Monosporascus cannonballus]
MFRITIARDKSKDAFAEHNYRARSAVDAYVLVWHDPRQSGSESPPTIQRVSGPEAMDSVVAGFPVLDARNRISVGAGTEQLEMATNGDAFPAATRRPRLIASRVSNWLMRLEPTSEGALAAYSAEVDARVLPGGTPLETRHTWIWAVDWMLTFMVAAFLPGTAGPDGGMRLRQSYLLLQLGSMVGLLAIKASRVKNRRRALSL